MIGMSNSILGPLVRARNYACGNVSKEAVKAGEHVTDKFWRDTFLRKIGRGLNDFKVRRHLREALTEIISHREPPATISWDHTEKFRKNQEKAIAEQLQLHGVLPANRSIEACEKCRTRPTPLILIRAMEDVEFRIGYDKIVRDVCWLAYCRHNPNRLLICEITSWRVLRHSGNWTEQRKYRIPKSLFEAAEELREAELNAALRDSEYKL